MKIDFTWNAPTLWEWAKTRLPRGLVAYKYIVGYGQIAGIYASQPSGLAAKLFGPSDPIALIDSNTISLYHPEWFSDFEDLGRRFEKDTGIEVHLQCWQAPKDRVRSSGGDSSG